MRRRAFIGRSHESVSVTIYAWQLTQGIWEQIPQNYNLSLSGNFDPSGKTILFEGYTNSSPSIEVLQNQLPFVPTTILFAGYSLDPPTIEVL
jgi:hypothetical protein